MLMTGLFLAREACAQSLGSELILSKLGDPVEVEIAVNDWQNVDLGRVQIANATRQQYEAFKLDYPAIVEKLNFNVIGPNKAGEVKILISSREPLNEPYLDLLLVLRWPEGSTLREYVLLFDPPQLEKPAVSERQINGAKAVAEAAPDSALAVHDPAPAVQPKPRQDAPPKSEAAPAPKPDIQREVAVIPPQPMPAAASSAALQPSEPKPQSVPEPVKAEQKTERKAEQKVEQKAEPARETATNDNRRQYRVRNGDTLWTIQRQLQRGGSENAYQFLLSLHELNKGAFINGNISMLRAGATLNVPTARDMAGINPASARQLFEQQWREGVTNSANAIPPSSEATLKPFEPASSAPVAKPTEPKLPRGTEQAAPVARQETVLAPTTDVAPVKPVEPVPAKQVETDKQDKVPAIAVVPEQVAQPPPKPAATKVPANPFLQKITDSATTIENMLEKRRQRMLDLEQQIRDLQTELEQAQQRANELHQHNTTREQVQAETTRNAVLLGLLAAGLLIGLAFTVRLGLQWHQETQRLARRLKRQSL